MAESSWQKQKVTNILQNLAAAYLANRQYENAIEKFLQLKALSDEDPSTGLGLAGAFLGLKKTSPDALDAYRRFCDLFPEDGELISNIAELLLTNHARGNEALHIYRCALAFHPPFERELHLVLIEALEARGDLPLALQAARSAALLPGGDSAAVKKLVALSWRQRRFDELLQELMMLAEQPALAHDVRRFIALTLAYRAFENSLALTAKESRFVENVVSMMQPVKTLAQARDFCLLQLAVARSERPSAILVEQAAASEKSEIAHAQAYFRGSRQVETGTAGPLDFSGTLWAGDEDNTNELIGGEEADDAMTAHTNAVLVIAANPPLALLENSTTSQEVDDSFRYLFEGMNFRTQRIRRFADGLIAIAESPHELVDVATTLLRSSAGERLQAKRPRFPFCALIHAMRDDYSDEALRTLSLLSSALQLLSRSSLSAQSEDRKDSTPNAKLFITTEALDAGHEAAGLVITNPRRLPAGIVGPEVEVGEIIWQNPFEARADQRPAQIGRFVVGKKICSMEFFSTFMARDHTLGVAAILKAFSPRHSTNFEEEEIWRAIRRAGRLTHPGLPLVHDMGTHEGVFYFIREFVEGHSLAEEQSFGQVRSVTKILTFGMQACRALQFAHREGVLHLNLKPSNFWLTPEGKVKLTDFSVPGLHHVAGSHGGAERERNYLAPELRESSSSSPASDVYSLAALLFLMISHLPSIIAEDDFFAPLDFSPDQRVPEPLKEILFAAIAHDPLARPQSMVEFERQLRDCQSLLPSTVS